MQGLAAGDLGCTVDRTTVVELERGFAAICLDASHNGEQVEYYHCGSYGCANYRVEILRAAEQALSCPQPRLVVFVRDRERAIVEARGCGRSGFYVCGLDGDCLVVSPELVETCEPSATIRCGP